MSVELNSCERRIWGVFGRVNNMNESMTRAIAHFDRVNNRKMKHALRGLVKIQKKVRRNLDTVAPLIPVDTGNARRSWYGVTGTGDVVNGVSPVFDDQNRDAAKLATGHKRQLAKAMTRARINNGVKIVFGLSAYYAATIHEMYGATFRRRGAGAGFFNASVNHGKRGWRRIIAEEMRKPS